MTFTRALATNNYGPAKFIVDGTTVANGTHSTISAALTSASAGDTIFIRPGTYTENLTLKAGVNLFAYDNLTGTPQVSIVGKLSFSSAGDIEITNINVQTNGDFAVEVTGSAASAVTFKNCFLQGVANTIVSFTSSSASSQLQFDNTVFNVETTGITTIISTSVGTVNFNQCRLLNTGGSTTASTSTAGTWNVDYSLVEIPVSISTAGLIRILYSRFNATNAVCVTYNVAGSTVQFRYSHFASGNAAAITVTAGTVILLSCVIDSSAVNTITGAGTLQYDSISFLTSNGISPTTNASALQRQGITLSTLQPAFLAVNSATDSNVTGDGTAYTIIFDSEQTDQNGDYNTGTGVFTAPFTGLYLLSAQVLMVELGAGHTFGNLQIVTTQSTYNGLRANYAAMRDSGNNLGINTTCVAKMTAGDTASVVLTVANSTKTVDVFGQAFASGAVTAFEGYLLG